MHSYEVFSLGPCNPYPPSRTTTTSSRPSSGFAIGATGDVTLFKNPDAQGFHGLRTNANFTVDGEVIVNGKSVSESLQAALERAQSLNAEGQTVLIDIETRTEDSRAPERFA